jgi:hypothetical protein
MVAHAREPRMTDLSPTFLSSATNFVAAQTAKIGNAATDTKNTFAAALNRASTTVGLKPKAGFTAGPTYQATTLTGQTQSVLTKAVTAPVNVVKSALNIK